LRGCFANLVHIEPQKNNYVGVSTNCTSQNVRPQHTIPNEKNSPSQQWWTLCQCPESRKSLSSLLLVLLSVNDHYSSNLTIRNKADFFPSQGATQSLPLSSCFFNEQHDHGELWVDAPKANNLHLHFWLLHHWNCHHLRQPQSNQQWWWSIVAWDRCIDAMPPSSWAAQQMTTSTLPYFFCGWSTRKCTAHITECPCIG